MSFGLVVLISGRGSNLQALIDARRHSDFEINGVISNQANAGGLALAASANIPTAVIDHRNFNSRALFDAALIEQIEQWHCALLVLAGFMRVLTPDFVETYLGRVINIHPSLLPQFPGLHTHERALKAAVKTHGASVHYVTAELDGGPVIAQTQLALSPADTPESLAERLLPQEHQLLTQVVELICRGQINYRQGKVVWNGKMLQHPILV